MFTLPYSRPQCVSWPSTQSDESQIRQSTLTTSSSSNLLKQLFTKSYQFYLFHISLVCPPFPLVQALIGLLVFFLGHCNFLRTAPSPILFLFSSAAAKIFLLGTFDHIILFQESLQWLSTICFPWYDRSERDAVWTIKSQGTAAVPLPACLLAQLSACP